MNQNPNFNYKHEYARYRHYFGRIYQFYQNPVTKVSTALLLTIFTTIFFAVFAIRPTLVTIAELIRKIEDQGKTLNELKKKAGALATAQQEFMSASDAISLLPVMIPDRPEVDPLLTYVEGTAGFHQLPLGSFSVEEFTLTPQGSEKTSGAIALTLSSSASYPSIKSFIKDLTRLPRLLYLDAINIGQGKDETVGGSTSVNINGRAFTMPFGAAAPSIQEE